ncbi:MAG: PQQ-binding-like beta-propeller repeat protein, partial [Candidatus Thermoplasmatota archaeon]|nr:PQQ-binding-like beta-propeller repeat protein [Candidatus Thermoplasmatota archaeon]
MERKMSIPKVISISLLLIMLPVFGGEGSGFSGTSGVKDMEIWYGGGQLEWKTYLGEHNRTSISTPELCDLNNDGDLEIIVATMNGSIFALDPDGSMFWTEPYMDLEIEALGERNWTGPGNITPVPFFSSPTAVDINPGANPEIVIGGKGKIVCIGADGQKQWNYSIPNSSVFSPVTVTDLEGEFNGSREYWEIVFIADHENGTSSLICLDTTGKENFRYWLGEEYFGLGSAVAISDLDGDFRSNGTSVDPDPGKERSQEMVFSGYGHSLNILGIGYNSSSDEYETYLSIREAGADISSSTPCIVNMDDDREMEIMVLNNYGSEQNSSKGNRSAFDPDGEIVWSNANDSAGSGFFGSPVAADLDNLIRDSGEDYSPDIITVGYDSILRVLNSSNGVEKWNFDTGSPIYSSPAICDINMDLEAEIVVSSSDGKIFMLDGDPTDGIDEGAPYPGDGPEQDVLWVYDTRTEIGISSPVIADIDLDGQLEVVVGDTSGNVYCISTCGFACRGTMDWPTFQGNHNRTGVYSVYITYGVDIYPSVQGPGSRVRSISPLGTIIINLTIENIGKGISVLNRDKIFVKIDQ